MMKCPKCGTATRSIATRGNILDCNLRDRYCPKCGYKFMTIEKFFREREGRGKKWTMKA